MNVNTKVTLYTIIPLGYDPIDCTAIDYSVSENALTIECAEVDRLITRAEAAEAYIERIRQAMGGYADSDLASLAETLKKRDDALEAEVERLRAALTSLFDAHYGMSYHHCGDGDGLNPEEAAEIVALVKE